MNNLRILLVEDDPGRTERLLSLFASAQHPAVSVPTVFEAAEALSLQKFDITLFSAPGPAKELAGFVTGLRDSQTHDNEDTRIAVFSCFPEEGSVLCADGYLSPNFAAIDVEEAFTRFRESIQSGVSSRQTAPNQPAAFEPAEFEEQCAHESELMVEIIGLFLEECRNELPEMAAALAEGDFERLSRLAHTMKGSLASLQAPLARGRAQTLESAAKEHNLAVCSETLGVFEQDLAVLRQHLESFRAACLCR